MNAELNPAPLCAFPHAPGAMSARIRAFDWASHPLGPIAGWPPAMRQALELVLAARYPQALVWGPERRLLCNDAYAELLQGLPDAPGQRVQAVWGQEWRRLLPLVERAEAGEAVLVPSERLALHHARPSFFTFGLTPVRDAGGAVGGWVNLAIETTQAKGLQQRWRAEAHSLERRVVQRTADRDRLWNLSDALMLVLEFDGTIVAANPAWAQALGWSEAQSLGRHLCDFIHGDDIARLRQEALILRTAVQRRRLTLRLVCRQGQPVRTVAWSVVAADGLLHAVGRDETEELERDRQLSDAQEHMRHMQRMEAIGQLTGGIAHDFNNMLQGIVLPLQLMQRRLQQGRAQDAAGYIDAALGSTRRAASLTQRLLAFSRRQPLEVRPTDVAAMLGGLDHMLRSSCGENITLDVQVQADLWSACVDQHQLESAVLNLAINARDAMAGRGALHIAAVNACVGEGHAGGRGCSALDPGRYVLLSLRDSGCGMAPEVVDRLFQPFFTTKPVGQGTGLGLSMVYGYMRQIGGAVEIRSQPGQGTTVLLYLPRSRLAPPAAQAVQLGGQSLAGRRDSVLLVEDDDTVRALVVELLGELDLCITQAADGSQAMALLSGQRQFDLLIADVGLPGPSGHQVAELARQQNPDIRVLLMTGYADRGDLDHDLHTDRLELLAKPFDAPALVRKVRQVMGLQDAAPRG